MGLEGGTAGIVLGFREEPWPKGHGYLYWRKAPGGKELMLCNCNLFEVDDGVVSSMFEQALVKVARQLGIEPRDVSGLPVTTENMSALAERMLRNVIERTSNKAS